MTALPKRIYRAEEYLALEESADYRSQFYGGEIYAMAGASRRHNVVAGNVYAALHFQLRQRPCEIYQNDMRVKVSADLYTYPDIVVVCGEPQIERKHGENLLNPLIIIEVLSPSTEKFDRGEKARLYRLDAVAGRVYFDFAKRNARRAFRSSKKRRLAFDGTLSGECSFEIADD